MHSFPRGSLSPSRQQSLRLAFGPLSGDAMRLCKANPEIRTFLRDAPAETRQYVALALAGLSQHGSNTCAGKATVTTMEDLAKVVATKPRREVLAAAWGIDLGPTRGLSRLGRAILTQASYLSLARVLSSAARREAFLSFRAVGASMIEHLARAPDAACAMFQARLLAVHGHTAVAFMFEGLKRLRPDLDSEDIRRRLNALDDPEKVDQLAARLMIDVPLPSPPWNGAGEIRPLRSVRELKATGFRLLNCLSTYGPWTQAYMGLRAFYIAEGPELCVAALEHHPLFKAWYLCAIRARGNKSPTRERKAMIAAAFTAAGFPFIERGAVPDIYAAGL